MNEQQQEQQAQAAAQAAIDAAAAAAAIQLQAPPQGQGGGAAGAVPPANLAALTQQVQALLNANAALQAQLNAAGAGAAPVPPVVAGAGIAGAIIIADTPGSYDVNNLLDYSSKVGISIYNQATKSLTTRFGMTPEEVVVFLQEFKERADANGWSKGNYNVTKFVTASGTTVHIHEGYGLLEAASISAQCEIFVNPAGANYNSRARKIME